MRFHVGHIGILGNLTTSALSIGATNQVIVVTAIYVEGQGYALFQEAQVNAEVPFVLLFIG